MDTREFVFSKCDLCDDRAVAVIRADQGCTCLKNTYQRRCPQHMIKLQNSDFGEYEIVEDYTASRIYIGMNEYESACKEFLKGCTCSDFNFQEECTECLTAFCNHIRKLAGEENYPLLNKNV